MNIIGAYQRTNVPFEGLRVQSSRSSKFKVWFTVYGLLSMHIASAFANR